MGVSLTVSKTYEKGVCLNSSAGLHNPVMIQEVLDALQPREGETYLDATFGAGGYTRAILDAVECKVLAFDRDPSAATAGLEMSQNYGGRLNFKLVPFAKLYDWTIEPGAEEALIGNFDGVVFDLGVSSMQIDQPERGFSFQVDGPIDMRMFKAGGAPVSEDGLSAKDVINEFDEAQLADIFFQLGEEKRSRAIAKAIVSRRSKKPFERTLDLAEVIEQAVGGRRGQARHPATRTFQSLRMFVNDELGQLVKGLSGAERCLKPGGRLVVVTFHSLEDRIVKRFFAQRAGKLERVSRHMPLSAGEGQAQSFQIVNQRSLTSSKGEIQVNPRARSARLRWGVRTDLPAFPLDFSNLGVPRIARVQA